ncbi:MAG TPA: gliding motility-associated C-terminal domain-containing protein, partial [Bacteroidales bacterium]|nr:gliding motility-associated C-terminal domain-containing protein [Bacteroidales bacterium]
DGIIQISMTGGTPEYKYIWSDGNNEPNAQMLAEGIYDIRITDQHDCLVDTSIEIIEPEKLLIYPVIQQPTCPDIQNGFIELNINGGRTPYMVYWENGSFDENLYNIRSGIYDVVITDSSLCEIDTSFTIRSAHPFCFDIPTAFSPNNDGFNDKWVIDMKGLYPGAEIEVFDRTGSRVFYSKGYDESKYWDGTYNGKKLPMDAYYYIIYLRNGMKRISGTVTIVR